LKDRRFLVGAEAFSALAADAPSASATRRACFSLDSSGEIQ
jgi:hypothetical protein